MKHAMKITSEEYLHQETQLPYKDLKETKHFSPNSILTNYDAKYHRKPPMFFYNILIVVQ